MADGRTAHGFGDHFLLRDSAAQAFSEAWERYWFHSLASSGGRNGRQFISTNGFAGERTIEAARRAARQELIERALVLEAWRLRRGWREIAPTGLGTRILGARLAKAGWRVRFFRLSSSHLGSALCALARDSDGRALFDSAYLADGPDFSSVQRKLARSLTRSLLLNETPEAIPALPDSAQPSSHAQFYRHPSNAAAFEFLDAPEPGGDLDLGPPEAISTMPIFDGGGLPSVAVAWNDLWPELTWGTRSILPGQNPWPHPIA